MKVITLQQLETNFDEVMNDIEINKEHYKIQNNGKDVMLLPVESFDVLSSVYTDWVEEPQNIPPVEGFDPLTLPMQYIGDAEPELN